MSNITQPNKIQNYAFGNLFSSILLIAVSLVYTMAKQINEGRLYWYDWVMIGIAGVLGILLYWRATIYNGMKPHEN